MRRPDPDGRHGGALVAAQLLAGGAAGALLLTLLQVPAGTLIGAVLGSAVANRISQPSEPRRPLPVWVRVVGLVLLGSITGIRLDQASLATLAEIAAPLAAAILALLVLDLALAGLLIRRYRIDPLTAVLSCAPGGLSEIAVTAHQMGARTSVVLAVHGVRVLVVVLLVLPLLVVVLGAR